MTKLGNLKCEFMSEVTKLEFSPLLTHSVLSYSKQSITEQTLLIFLKIFVYNMYYMLFIYEYGLCNTGNGE